MKIACGNCKAVFTLDDSKIPAHDVNFMCKKCEYVITIPGVLKTNPQDSRANLIACPKCGHEQKQTVECDLCGVIFEKITGSKTKQVTTKPSDAEYKYSQKNVPIWKQKQFIAFVSISLAIIISYNLLNSNWPSAKAIATTPKTSTTTREILPSGYETLDSITDTYRNLSSLKKKNEFETLGDFHSRMSQHSGKIFNFKGRPLKHEVKYNADKRNLRVPILDLNNKTTLGLYKRNISRYTGSNAYGVSSDVEKTILKYYGLSFPNNRVSDLRGDHCYISKENQFSNTYAIISMNIEDAKINRDNIRLIYKISTLHIQDNVTQAIHRGNYFTEYDYYHSKPTVSDPNDYTEYTYAVKAYLLEITIFNNLTGDTLASIR